MPRHAREIPWLDRRNGSYTIFWYDPATRRTERLGLRTKDPHEAQNRYAAFLAEGKAAFDKRSHALSVSQALDHYFFEHIKKHALSPANTETSVFHLKAFFGEKPIQEIGVPECVSYKDFRAGLGIALSTIGKELGVLKAAARHAVKWKRLSLADMPTFEMPKIQRSKGIWLFRDELQHLFDTALVEPANRGMPYKTLSFLELCYWTGSRRNAIECLSWSQVNMLRRRINLAQDGERITKKRRPTIPIDPSLMPTLTRCLQHRKNNFVLGSCADMLREFDQVAEKANLLHLPERDGRPSAKLTPHMLRHSRATHMLEDGHSLWTVANLLGDTIQTVAAVYGHHSASHLEDALSMAPKHGSLNELMG